MGILGYFRRREACRLAAKVCQGHEFYGEIGHHLWSVTVFFEMYLESGAGGTIDDFGPKDAVDLKVIRDRSFQ